jgi:aminopeptidase
MEHMLRKYAHLLVHYCLDIQPGDRLLISTTILAEPLLREVYRIAVRAGAHVETDLSFEGQNTIFLQEASEEQLLYPPLFYQTAMEEFDAYLHIRAPWGVNEEASVTDPDKAQTRRNALKPVQQAYFRRTATRELKRCLCDFPTEAGAKLANMPLKAYQDFVFQACKLDQPDPVESWLQVRKRQQRIVDLLNQRSEFHYLGPHIDIRFQTQDRTWINSDGQTNMPSGEVYTSPVEDSVNGEVYFTYPAPYQGEDVEGVRLKVEQGLVTQWEATRGKDFLDRILQLDGARRFGEIAIGTNYDIQTFTRNILFDEKIGGTVHMALGQSYLQAGGKNKSAIHWDMITDMTKGGNIFADGELIYENGRFLNALFSL